MGVENVKTTNSVCEFVGTPVQKSNVDIFLNEYGTFLFLFCKSGTLTHLKCSIRSCANIEYTCVKQHKSSDKSGQFKLN